MSTTVSFDSLNSTITSRKLNETKQTVSNLCAQDGNSAEIIKSRLEIFVRHEALRLGGSNSAVDEINSFLEFVVLLAKDDLCAKALTVLSMQDILESSPRHRCEELFVVVETMIDTWKQPFFFDQCRNNVLRMCNDLLKRLSRTVDANFCGRILILLAKSLPLTERSGLNLMSQNNVTNLTTFEENTEEHSEEKKEEEPPVEKMEVEIGEISEVQNLTVDYDLYAKFWKLQDYFANPNLAYQKDQWSKFESNLNDVLSIFSENKLERSEKSITSPDSKDFELPKVVNKKEADELNFFSPKYLTSQKLFQFQLSDSQFRRYFLCQCLILTKYFLTSGIKFRDSTYLLTATQEKTIKELSDRCYQLLKETHPHGRHFATSIKKLIENDTLWSSWKNEGCPDWVSQLKTEKLLAFKRKPIRSYDPNSIDLGNAELTRLWEKTQTNLEVCSGADRNFLPDKNKYFDDLLDEFDPDQQVDEQYQSLSDEKFQWTCSRFLLHVNSEQSRIIPPMAMGTEKTSNVTAAQYLKSLVLDTAKTIPELKEKASEIRTKIDELQKKQEDEKTAAEEVEKQKLEKKERKENLLKAIELEKQKQQEREKQKEKSEVVVKVEKSPPPSTEDISIASTSEEPKLKTPKTEEKPTETSKPEEKRKSSGKRSESTEKPPTTSKDAKPTVKVEEKSPVIKSEKSSTKRLRSPSSARPESSSRSSYKRSQTETTEPPKRPPIREPESSKKEEMPAPKKSRTHQRSRDEKTDSRDRKRDRRDEPKKHSR